MNKALHNFWIDIILFLLLGMDIALVIFTRREPQGVRPGLAWHAHAALSTLLTLGCLVHILMHWRWFVAVLTGKAKGRMKLIMNSLVILTMVIANVSGHAVLASSAVSMLHSLTGAFAMIGLFVHGIKHTRWIAMTAKRLTDDGHTLQQM